MLEWLYNFIADEFLVVGLPRVVVLQNWRLGMFYKILQVMSVVVAVTYCVHERIFEVKHDVSAWGVGLWHERSQAGVAPVSDSLPPHCKDTTVYASEKDPNFKYKPASCKTLSNNDVSSVNGGNFFLPTFVDDSKVWDGSSSECGAQARKACSEQSAEAVFQEVDGRCSCALSEQFLVQDAGEQAIRFVYGYEVDASNGLRKDLRRGGILTSTAAAAGADHQLEEESIALVTQFWATDGQACTFGGKTQWLQSEAAGGITGTLNELLACAGVTLDSDPATLMAGTRLAPSHLRTMGFRLELRLLLSQDLFGDLTCNVRVIATPITTVVHRDDVIFSAFPRMGAVAHRLQRVHGVAMDVHVGGHIYTFRWYQVVRGVVDVLVVLTVPRMIVYFVAMYMLGLVSQVYRGAARTKFNIFSKFHGSIAKVLLAEVAFRGLVNNFTDHIVELGSVSPVLLLQRLEELFCHNLQREEISKLAAVVFTSMDKDHDEGIDCREFIQASTDDGEVNVATITRFFETKTSERTHHLRSILDDTESRADFVSKRSMSSLFTPADQLEDIHGSHTFTCQQVHSTGSDGIGDVDELAEKVRQNEVNTTKHLKDFSMLTDRVSKHEEEVARVLDDNKTTKHFLMERLDELERSLLQALGVLKEALHAHGLGVPLGTLQSSRLLVGSNTEVASVDDDHPSARSTEQSSPKHRS